MRSVQAVRLEGPGAVEVCEVPDTVRAEGEHLVEVHAVGVSFPDLLMSKGEYQIKLEPPVTLGVDFAGIIVEADPDGQLSVGDRVMGWSTFGNASDLVSAPEQRLLRLPDELSFADAAAVPLNYLTAHFALRIRGGGTPGDHVLVTGAAGGIGTTTLQVARALGMHPLGVIADPALEQVARDAGAEDVIVGEDLSSVRELTGGHGVDIVIDVVGTEELTRSALRQLATQGRFMSLGYVGGTIPSVKLNRLLLSNTDIRGVSWGPFTRANPDVPARQWEELAPLFANGSLKPVIGASYPIDGYGRALQSMDQRTSTGKNVVLFR